ncbi:MAG TPA: TPM domain-containing protein, partial [Candidatus Limnocylindrales bacterium]
MRPYRRLAAIGLAAAAVGAWLAIASVATAATTPPPAGPPYPDAVTGQRVYDYAGIFSPAAISQTDQTIQGIEQRTGAQVAVYTQIKPESDSPDKANKDALALMNQWGVGRKGFDDGLVILFDMQANRQHGQVSLYAGSGFKANFLSDSDRQSIFDNDMKPLLKAGDFDGALKAAMDGIDAVATPEHADQLNRARIFNAIVGLG